MEKFGAHRSQNRGEFQAEKQASQEQIRVD